MTIYFINPPFKAEFGKFSRESRSPAITKSGALYYPLWLIYAAMYAQKYGGMTFCLLFPGKRTVFAAGFSHHQVIHRLCGRFSFKEHCIDLIYDRH